MSYAIKRKCGERIDYTPTPAVSAGTPIVIGGKVYVADRDIAALALGSLATEGVYDVAKSTSASTGWSDRAPLFWDDTNHVFSKDPTVGYFAGYAIGAAADGDATARMLLLSDFPPPAAKVTALTDSTTGTATATLAAVPSTYNQAYLQNSIASLVAEINLIISGQKVAGQMSST